MASQGVYTTLDEEQYNGLLRMMKAWSIKSLCQTVISAFNSNVVSEEEQEGESDTNEQEEAMSYLPDSRDSPLITDFDLNGPKESQQEAPTIINDEEDWIPQDVQAKFLQWHHRLGHVSPKKIQMLAKLSILPSWLAHCTIPLCTSCLFGKVTRRPW